MYIIIYLPYQLVIARFRFLNHQRYQQYHLGKYNINHTSDQIIVTSHEFSPPSGGLVREIPRLFQGNLGW